MYDIAIIGAGPGGYISAIRAAQLGAKVVLIEKDSLGGTCLNRGCIPSKVLLSTADKLNELKKYTKFGINVDSVNLDYQALCTRKQSIISKLQNGILKLLESYSIDIINGEAKILTSDSLAVNDSKVEFKKLIIATGSKPAAIPGIEVDHDFVIDSDDALSLESLPESILIVGSGAIGLEWARIFSSLKKKVYLTEIAPQLFPASDKCISSRIERLLKKQRVEFYKETSIENINNKVIKLSNGKIITPDKVLLAVGRQPNIENLGLENTGIALNGKYIKVDENLKTNIDNIYAIGDVTGKLQLAHVASHQGISVVEHILEGKQVHINYDNVPSVIYGQPEIASVGKTEYELEKNKVEYKVSTLPITAIGKALIEDDIDGFVKVLSVDGKVVGAHIIAKEASSLLQQFVISMQIDNNVSIIKNAIFPHPTYSEAVYESVLGLDNLALHLPKG